MKRTIFVILGAMGVAACAGLFGDATQCESDGDCAHFGPAVTCQDNVCKSGTITPKPDAVADTSVDVTSTDAPNDVVVDPQCLVPNKPQGTIDGDSFDAAGVNGITVTRSQTLDCGKDWVVSGRVFVRANVTLTIQPGTTIKLQKGAALVFVPGSRVQASGRADAPIVVTSAEAAPAPGDHGGIVVLGVAPRHGNAPFAGDSSLGYGGANPDDNSGTLRYVRVEYGGVALAGVGRQTTVDFVEVRRAPTSCFSMQGGTVDVRHIVCQRPGTDFFAFGDGYAGRGQFLYGQRIGGAGAGLAVDDAEPVLYNLTLCGDPQPSQSIGLAMRNESHPDVANAIVTGFGAGVDVVGTASVPMELRSSIAFANTGNPAFDEIETDDPASPTYDDDFGFDENAWFADGARMNATTDPILGACFDAKAPNPAPAAALTSGFRTPPFDGFFDPKALYIGAFKDVNDGWTRAAWVRFAED